MPDLSSGHDIPNPYGLLASDFAHDIDSYGVALRFLSDLAGGSDEPRALTANGGSIAMLRAWEGSRKFRRVLGKCREAGVREREAARKKADAAEAATAEDTQVPVGFIPLDRMPPTRTTFSRAPDAASWGE